MADISQIRNFKLKLIFIIHFILIALSLVGFWTSSAYLYYNLIFIATLLWAIKDFDGSEGLQIAIVINSSSVILDIILIVMGFPESDRAREKFSAAMAILHLIIRPITTIYLLKILEERGGIPEGGVNSIFPGRRTESYEDIDRNLPGPATAGYDVSSAQRI